MSRKRRGDAFFSAQAFLPEKGGLASVPPFLHSFAQPFGKIFHDVRNMDLLRTYGLAAAAADAGRRLFFRRHRVDGIACGEAAVGEYHIIIQPDQFRNVELLRAVRGAVMTSGARNACAHMAADAQQFFHLIVVQRLFARKGADIILQLRHLPG